MSKSKNTVGANKTYCNPVGNFGFELHAPVGGGDVTFTVADIVSVLVANGSTYNDAAAIAAGALIHQIDIGLKPVAGEGKYWDGAAFADAVATSSNAVFTVNNLPSDVDPSGSRCDAMFDVNGCPVSNQFQSVLVTEGSVVTITGEVVAP